MNFKKPGPYLVGAFLVLAAWMLWNEAEASEFTVAAGPTVVSGSLSSGFTLVFEETFVSKYRVALGYVSPQTCKCSEGNIPIKENAYIHVGRVIRRGNFEISLGPLYQVEPNRVTSSRLNFKLGMRYQLGKSTNNRLAIGITHVSNAGAGGPINQGWNTGQDTYPEIVLRLKKDK